MPPSADDVIRWLDLVPLPEEGGFYRETYRSAMVFRQAALPAAYDGDRNASTAIYYLVTPEEFSALHRLPTDEVFHFYAGDPVEMLQVSSTGPAARLVLGSDLANGQRPQVVAPGGVWQGTRVVPGGQWALLGCTVAPGFEFRDFSTPSAGEVAELERLHPQFAELIVGLTRRSE